MESNPAGVKVVAESSGSGNRHAAAGQRIRCPACGRRFARRKVAHDKRHQNQYCSYLCYRQGIAGRSAEATGQPADDGQRHLYSQLLLLLPRPTDSEQRTLILAESNPLCRGPAEEVIAKYTEIIRVARSRFLASLDNPEALIRQVAHSCRPARKSNSNFSPKSRKKRTKENGKPSPAVRA